MQSSPVIAVVSADRRSFENTGRFELQRFYLHRSRRLLPALSLVLVTVLAVTWVVDRAALDVRWDETVAAALYVSNWFTIAAGQSYVGYFAGPQPLGGACATAVPRAPDASPAAA